MGIALLIIPIMFAIGVTVSAVLLRAGVSITNRVLGPQKVESNPLPAFTGMDQDPPVAAGLAQEVPAVTSMETSAIEDNPFAAPVVVPQVVSPFQVVPAIKEPSFGLACGIVLVSWITSYVLSFIFTLAFQSSSELAIMGVVGVVLNLVAQFMIAILIYSVMLPTSFGKAALVYIFQILILFAIMIPIFLIVFGIGAISS